MAAGGRWKGWSGSFDFPKRHGALPSIKKHLMGFSLDKNGLDAKHSIKINVHSEHHCHVVLSIGTSLLFSAGNQFHLLLLFFHSHGNCESPCATFQAPQSISRAGFLLVVTPPPALPTQHCCWCLYQSSLVAWEIFDVQLLPGR